MILEGTLEGAVMDSFEDYVEEIKKLEKKKIEYSPYGQKIEIKQLVDLSPDDYVDLSFDNLLNLYERMQKINLVSSKLARALGVEGAAGAAPAPGGLGPVGPAAAEAETAVVGEKGALKKEEITTKKKEEVKAVEEAIKKMTEENIQVAEKIKSVELPEEKLAKSQAPEEKKYTPVIEFEREVPSAPSVPSEGKIEFEKEERKQKPPTPAEFEVREIEISHEIDLEKLGEEEKQKIKPSEEIPEEAVKEEAERAEEAKIEFEEKEKAEEREEKAEERKPEEVELKQPEEIEEKRLEEKRPVAEEVKIVFPAVTLESADKAAEERYKEIEKEVLAMVGEGADEVAIKKKMLDLTKELFKEKSTARREHIKLQITVLKNLLNQKKEQVVAKRGRAKKEAEPTKGVAYESLLQTITTTQNVELSQAKDSIMANYKNQIVPLWSKFEKALGEDTSEKDKKDAYDSLVFNLTSILEHTPAVMAKYRDYLKKKHLAEIANIEKNVSKTDKELLKKIEERKKEIERYDKEFVYLEDIIKKEIETIIRRGGRAIFKKPEIEKTAQDIEEEKVDAIIGEIQAIDDGTLLFYLHSKDPLYYKKYERKQISKAEALSHAKSLMAKEKGLGPDVIKKYFSNNVGE